MTDKAENPVDTPSPPTEDIKLEVQDINGEHSLENF